MRDERVAAQGRREIWQAHDERDQELAIQGGYKLFDALAGADDEDLYEAGRLVKDAFWLADKAEKFQENGEYGLEDKMYKRSTRLLKEARDKVDLPYESMEYRGNGWWKDYRRDNKLGVLKNLFLEQVNEVGWIYSLSSARALLEAAEAHDSNDWGEVEDRLEEHYRILINQK